MIVTRKASLVLCLLLLSSACAQAPGQTASPQPITFATSTLPPTRPAFVLPTPIAPTASPTLDPAEATQTPSCRDSALFVEDVTYPDHTRLTSGEKFTKTWKFKNTGGCAWKGYTIAFVSGDKLDAPEKVAVPETEVGSEVEVSVDLVAPAADGSYTGNFELRDEKGKAIPLGTEPTFWVKIIVGEEAADVAGTIGNCAFTENPDYVNTLVELINQSRAEVGRPALTVSPELSEAARRHSLDMACNDFMKHSGSDGSWTGDRVTDAGYTNPYYLEILAIGLPQDAMNQWRIERNDWGSVINSRVRDIGVGYVFSKFSSYGGYWTVVMGGP